MELEAGSLKRMLQEEQRHEGERKAPGDIGFYINMCFFIFPKSISDAWVLVVYSKVLASDGNQVSGGPPRCAVGICVICVLKM